MRIFNPAHPGGVLREAYIDPLNVSVTKSARRIGISRKRVSDYVNKHAGTTVEAKATDTTAESRLMMRVQYSLWEAKKAEVAEHIHVQRLAFANEQRLVCSL